MIIMLFRYRNWIFLYLYVDIINILSECRFIDDSLSLSIIDWFTDIRICKINLYVCELEDFIVYKYIVWKYIYDPYLYAAEI
jgi:hypothetical protein